MTIQACSTFWSALILVFFTQSGMAQPVYKIVGADGKVTFSDKPPASTDKGKLVLTTTAADASNSGNDLPYELRQVVSKYPVTLYASSPCGPCDAGRSLLKSRGIPFTERTIVTADDVEALQRLTGDSSLPFATIGGQKLRGFSDVEWTQYLDAAGYPGSSALPKNYRFATPTPLVAVQKPTAGTKETAKITDTPAATEAPVSPTPSNPAGITF